MTSAAALGAFAASPLMTSAIAVGARAPESVATERLRLSTSANERRIALRHAGRSDLGSIAVALVPRVRMSTAATRGICATAAESSLLRTTAAILETMAKVSRSSRSEAAASIAAAKGSSRCGMSLGWRMTRSRKNAGTTLRRLWRTYWPKSSTSPETTSSSGSRPAWSSTRSAKK
eukprot:Amastigsp_a177787_14.p3 type:complete len:176 gc:universal Amastigsp_a177787_14:332-859(+)